MKSSPRGRIPPGSHLPAGNSSPRAQHEATARRGASNGPTGQNGSLKERKFSLLYRDVLDCASHVLRSKDEFQEKYRDTQDRIGKSEIAVREMILELEEDFKGRLNSVVRNLEHKILAEQDFAKSLCGTEANLRETMGLRFEKLVEKTVVDLKDWNADFCRDIAAKCDEEINLTKAQIEKEAEKRGRVVQRVEELLLEKIVKGESTLKEMLMALRKSVEVKAVDEERARRTMSQQIRKLEEDRLLDKKVMEEIESAFEKRIGMLEVAQRNMEKKDQEDTERYSELHLDFEKRVGLLECKGAAQAERTKGLEEKQDENTKCLKDKIDSDISHVCDTLETMKERQDRVNKKLEMVLKERHDQFLTKVGEIDHNFKKSHEDMLQKVQGAVDYVKNEYIAPVRLDLDGLQRDFDDTVGDMKETHGQRNLEMESLVRGIEKKLTTDFGSHEEEYKNELCRQKMAYEELSSKIQKTNHVLRETEAKLVDSMDKKEDNLNTKIVNVNNTLEKKLAHLGSNIDGAKREFLENLKKQGQTLSEETDFKLEAVSEKTNKAVMDITRVEENLRAFQGDANLQISDTHEQLMAKINDTTARFQQDIGDLSIKVEANADRTETTIEQTKNKFSEDLADQTCRLEGKFTGELKEHARALEAGLLSADEKSEAINRELVNTNKTVQKIQHQLVSVEKSLNECASKSGTSQEIGTLRGALETQWQKVTQLQKKAMSLQQTVDGSLGEKCKTLETQLEQTNFKIRKHVDEQLRKISDESTEKIFALREKVETDHCERQEQHESVKQRFNDQISSNVNIVMGRVDELLTKTLSAYCKDSQGRELSRRVTELETRAFAMLEGVEKTVVANMRESEGKYQALEKRVNNAMNNGAMNGSPRRGDRAESPVLSTFQVPSSNSSTTNNTATSSVRDRYLAGSPRHSGGGVTPSRIAATSTKREKFEKFNSTNTESTGIGANATTMTSIPSLAREGENSIVESFDELMRNASADCQKARRDIG